MRGRELLEVRAVVKGEVQGVGYRAIARRHAEQLGLTGFVRNLPDGRVEFVAQGEKMVLENFIKKMREEFHAAELQYDYHEIGTERYFDFKIIR